MLLDLTYITYPFTCFTYLVYSLRVYVKEIVYVRLRLWGGQDSVNYTEERI